MGRVAWKQIPGKMAQSALIPALLAFRPTSLVWVWRVSWLWAPIIHPHLPGFCFILTQGSLEELNFASPLWFRRFHDFQCGDSVRGTREQGKERATRIGQLGDVARGWGNLIMTHWLFHITLDLNFGVFEEKVGVRLSLTLFKDRVAGG